MWYLTLGPAFLCAPKTLTLIPALLSSVLPSQLSCPGMVVASMVSSGVPHETLLCSGLAGTQPWSTESPTATCFLNSQ